MSRTAWIRKPGRALRALAIVAVTAIVAGTALLFLPTVSRPEFLSGSGGDSGENEITVAPQTLRFTIETTGVLRATSVQYFSAPPQFGRYWQFQLVSMIQEGKNVKKGDILITFDEQKLRDDLGRLKNELDQATKELEKSEIQINLESAELAARLAEAENRFQKLKLKHEGSSALIESSRSVELDRLALEQARLETVALQSRIEWHRKSSEAARNIIASKKARAANKVAEIEKGMEGFQVRATRDGVAVHKVKWNGEKYQVGENVWSGLPLIEIPDLETIVADLYVPEVDLAKVRIGQKVEVSIDALPGRIHAGSVAVVGTLVRAKAWDIQNKILDVQVNLERVDPSAMRPGMSVRARIQTGEQVDVLAVPLKAVQTTANGVRVKVRSKTGWSEQRVVLGESDGENVVVLEGLKPGDHVARDFAKAL